MLSVPLLLVAGGLMPTFVKGTPVPSFLSGIVETVKHSHFLEGRESSTSYAVFGGSGETSNGWPSMSDWVTDFDTMFAAQKGVMSTSCTQWGVADNTDSEISEISTAIQSVASSTGVDARFILAIVMQESNGCVRAPTTNYGVRNPGLMQSHNGAGTCNDASVSNPCPSNEITQMITDGTAGTSSGDGLKQCITESGATDVSMYYKAARIYNSGSIDSNGNLGAGIATHCYASDIANRLIGWSSGPSSCSSTTIETLTTSESFVSGGSGLSDSSSVAVSATTTSKAVPVVTSSAPESSSSAAESVSGGAFIQTAASSVVPEPSAKAVNTPVSDPAPATTATVVPVPASSVSATPQSATTTPVASVTASSTAPSSTSTVGTGSAIAAGTACITEGEWNCINGTSFQQCGSGTWSVVQQVAAGTTCTSGLTMDIDIVAGKAKREVRFASGHVHRHLHHF